ncbi:Zinc finger BED domain-containing protein DAYSLEEPER [Rhynchospora pubera]|uniref:Zinc finger BED domain-containing protein DAYSLEEPER n=1 Tax=Rhynchospora pubera TaxID=906938 RepID=A0AAV8HIR2_9POAL|nr:Zinc finger BED domain-containing protein DAYSLEEPER [Rhynchospora pubera]
MGPGLNFETPEEIQRIEIDAAAAEPQPQNVEQTRTTKRKKVKENLKAAVWAHFKRGETQEDGSYTATCLYCGHIYPMGNQRGTGNMKHHIKRGCKKVPASKRQKPDALQKLLQAGKDAAGQPTVASWVFDQKKCRKSFAKCVIAHDYPFNCANHYFLKVNAPNKKPAWDVETRWNSTYLMLELALQLKEAINRYALYDNNFGSCPNDVDWEHVEAVACHLKVFYDVTNKLSGTKYPTLNIFFPEYCEVYLTLIKMSKSDYPFVVNMSKEMYKKWDKYWKIGNVLLAVACVLDPRCKLAVVEYYFKMMLPEECNRFMENLKACLHQLFKEYSDAHFKGNQNQATNSSTEMRSNISSSSSVISDTRAGLQNFLSDKRTTDPTKSELEEYLSDALDGTSLDAEFDILAWWKLKSPKYPILAKLTRDILAVPISTVASESTFSTAGRTLSPIRSSLNDESLEALICAQDWLRASVTESGGVFGDVMWSRDESLPTDDSVCGSVGNQT